MKEFSGCLATASQALPVAIPIPTPAPIPAIAAIPAPIATTDMMISPFLSDDFSQHMVSFSYSIIFLPEHSVFSDVSPEYLI